MDIVHGNDSTPHLLMPLPSNISTIASREYRMLTMDTFLVGTRRVLCGGLVCLAPLAFPVMLFSRESVMMLSRQANGQNMQDSLTRKENLSSLDTSTGEWNCLEASIWAESSKRNHAFMGAGLPPSRAFRRSFCLK